MHLRKMLAVLVSVMLAPDFAQAELAWVSSGPGGGGALASPAQSVSGSVIVPSDLGGVYRSADGGRSWTAIGVSHGLATTHVDAATFHPSIDGAAFLGADEGIYRSTNCATSPPGPCTFTRTPVRALVTSIATASWGTATTTTVYASGIDWWCDAGPHLWRSLDNGASWTEMAARGLPSNANIMAIRVQPGNSSTLVAISARSRFTACGANYPVEAPNRAFISTDGGVSFTPILVPTSNPALLQSDSISAGSWAYVEDVKFDKAEPSKLWLTVTAVPSSGAYWTIDGELWMSTAASGVGNGFIRQSAEQTGQIWPLTSGAIRVIDLRRQHLWDSERAGFHQWTPSTSTWARVTSTADFNAWQRGWAIGYGASLNGYLHTITPVDDSTLWWVDAQFVYKTTDGGHVFQQAFTTASDTSAGYVSTRIDNSVPAVLVPNPVDSTVLYAGYFDLGCWKSANATAPAPSWADCNGPKSQPPDYPPSPWNGGWRGYGGNATAIAADPSAAATLWAVHSVGNGDTGTYKIARSTDGGSSWTDQSFDLPDLTGSAAITDLLVEAPTAGTRRLWAIADNRLFKLQDGAVGWAQVKTPCDGGLSMFSKSGARFLAGGSAGICTSVNGGAKWRKASLLGGAWIGPRVASWWNSSYSGISDFAFHPKNNRIAWATLFGRDKTAESSGLYTTTDGGLSWKQVKSFAPRPFGRNFARTVAVSPMNPKVIAVGTSTAMTAGGYRPPDAGDSGQGVWISRDGGATWSLENEGLAWPFMTRLRFTGGARPRLWGISPGQGVVYSSTAP